jgi:hypothetical protein
MASCVMSLPAPLRAGGPQQKPAAASGQISADRPDYTESTDTAGRGIVQLEGGALWSSDSPREGQVDALTVPNALLRIGLVQRVELRVESDGFAWESVRQDGTRQRYAGGSDLAIGAKVAIFGERRLLPAFSFIGALSAPVGSVPFSSGGFDPFLKLCWEKSLPKGFGAGGNVNFRWGTAGPETLVERAISLSVGHELPGGLHAFWEIYRISPGPYDNTARTIGDTGLSKLLGRNAEVDFAVGHTLAAHTPGWFVTVGFAVRSPLAALAR